MTYKMQRVKCSVCGKDCAASLHGAKGDWSKVMPRRHYVDKTLCKGVYKWAIE